MLTKTQPRSHWIEGDFGDPRVDVIDDCLYEDNLDPVRLVELFNRRYAVTVEGSKVWVVWFDNEPINSHIRFRRIGVKEFLQLHRNHKLTVKPPPGPKARAVTKTWGEWWFESPDRREYPRGVVFDPADRQELGLLNLWRGWGVVPRQGGWTLMQEHILTVICGGDVTAYNYLLQWLARMVQLPHLPGEKAIVLRGGKGIGKGVFGLWLLRMVGQHGRHISNVQHLIGRFNAHLRDCIFLFADEAFFAGDKAHERVLKQLITEGQFVIEAKFQDATSAHNLLHILMSSNDDWVIPATHDERRYLVLEVSEAHQGDRAHFEALDNELEAGGAQAMLYDLLAMDLSGFDHRSAPNTRALEVQKLHSFDAATGWLFSVLDRGYVWESAYGVTWFAKWQDKVSTDLLIASFAQWTRKQGRRFHGEPAALGRFLSRFFTRGRMPENTIIGEVERVADKGDPLEIRHPGRPWGYQLGSLDAARGRFADLQRISTLSLGWDRVDDL